MVKIGTSYVWTEKGVVRVFQEDYGRCAFSVEELTEIADLANAGELGERGPEIDESWALEADGEPQA